MNRIGNSDNIVICLFPYICSFLLYANEIVLVNTKLDITGYMKMTSQSWILCFSNKLQMSQLKHKGQYCHSCIEDSL